MWRDFSFACPAVSKESHMVDRHPPSHMLADVHPWTTSLCRAVWTWNITALGVGSI
jgi:hypothetical protein